MAMSGDLLLQALLQLDMIVYIPMISKYDVKYEEDGRHDNAHACYKADDTVGSYRNPLHFPSTQVPVTRWATSWKHMVITDNTHTVFK